MQALYSRYVAESAAQTLLLPPSFPSYISSLLHPPYDDLFDRVEEHVLGVLMVYWETLCKRDEAEFQKVQFFLLACKVILGTLCTCSTICT